MKRSFHSFHSSRSHRGIALPAMVFLIVIVTLMLAAGLQMLTQSSHSMTLQVQATRALSAARSGAEWGLWQVSDPGGAMGLAGDTLPPCFANQTLALATPLSDMPVQMSCTREPTSGTVDEGGLRLASYRIVATAAVGNVGANDYVVRRFEAKHTVCKNPGGTAPLYAC